MDSRLREHSRVLIDGFSRAPARSYFKAIGLTEDDLAKPIVGIANTWIETMPCNFHLRRLAEKVKAGVRAAGGTPPASGPPTPGLRGGLRDPRFE